MTREEWNKLHEIDEKWNRLEQSSREQFIKGCGLVSPDGHIFEHIAHEFAQDIHYLHENYHPTYYTENIGAINSTLNGELKHVISTGKAMQRVPRVKNAKDEFYSSMQKVLEQFKIDYQEIFQKINEMKENGSWNTYQNE